MIKKIIFLLSVFLLSTKVYAEKFTVGEYINGEYIKMVSSNTSKYLTIQKILDSNNNFVYCIEPFVLVDQNTSDYTMYVKDLSGYKSLSEEQKRKVSLIAYYGYGYGNRSTEKWYAITQMLIWKTVDTDSDFYFTDTVNGNKIDKYTGSMNQILSDVYDHDREPSFIKDYKVNYGEDLIIDNYNHNYSIKSNYKYNVVGGVTVNVNDVLEDGTLLFERNNNAYPWDVVIYDNPTSQDLIKPGRVLNKQFTINVKVNSGDITLDIRKDNSDIYTTQSDFSNTCYEISNSIDVIDTVCTDDNLVYKTDKLPYGEYSIKQVSVGKGYEVDTNIYKVTIDSNSDTTILLDNKLIRNKIELVKYYCINDNCLYEENAVFNVYDINDNLVGSITTDSNGYGYIEVGYGEYTVIQEYGLDNYTFVDMYTEDIVNSKDVHYKELYNYFIEENIGGFDIINPDNTLDNEDSGDKVLPPKTGTKLAEFLKILYNVIMVVICCCNLKRFCYNN